MANKSQTNGNILCKYQEYLEPNVKKTSYDMPFMAKSKKRSMHKNRLSSMLPPPTLNKTQDNCHEALPQRGIRQSTQELSYQNLTLLSRKNFQQRKSDIEKLEKLFPKSVTIKFQEVLNSISNNRKMSKKSRPPKVGKNISPSKLFQMAQNRFYSEISHQKRKQEELKKEKQSTRNTIDSIFNVRSIKMIKKISEALPFKGDEKKFKNKFERMIKKQTDYSVQFQKENPPKYNNSRSNNLKLSLKNLRRFEELQKTSSSTKSRQKKSELKPFSQLHNRQSCKQERFSNKNGVIMTEHKPQSIHTANRSTSMMVNKRKNSKELSPMVFSLNTQVLNTSSNNPPINNKFLDSRLFVSKKSDSIFEEKFIKYVTMLKANGQILGIEINFPQTYSRNQFCFYVGNGNNSKLVKQMLKKRWWLGACQDKKDLQKNNVIWTQLKDKTYYLLNEAKTEPKDSSALPQQSKENMQLSQQPKRLIIHNHFEQNQFLGNKKALYYNMKAYYESQNQNVFDYLPLTFHITSLSDESWTSFMTNFNKIKQQDPTAKNIWILKPGQNSNRGNGITVHESIESIKNTMAQGDPKQKSTRTYILQKYIQKPFLYRKRKFDIRCYMLLVRINQTIKGFWYKQGYIRTSGYQFTLQDCDNSFVHLTNDAIQQHCDNYGKYEDKNKLSYQAFQKYLDQNFNSLTTTGEGDKKYDLQKHVLPKLRKVCIDSIKACSKCLGKWRDGLPTFQLFGLDFMIDEQFNPWLIEINTNPCLETEGRVLEKVIVPLLDNVFKLTIDCLIPPPLNWSNSNKHLLSKNVDKNLFELVFDEAEEVKSKTEEKDLLPMHMIGQIDQDNEVYEEDEEQ